MLDNAGCIAELFAALRTGAARTLLALFRPAVRCLDPDAANRVSSGVFTRSDEGKGLKNSARLTSITARVVGATWSRAAGRSSIRRLKTLMADDQESGRHQAADAEGIQGR